MSEGKLYTLIQQESPATISVRSQLLESLRDQEYRRQFVDERVRSSMALQIRSLRDQRDMSQKALGDALGMAQTWVSKLENPDYGKMSVATLLRLAHEFDTDLEIKFRPFSTTLDRLPKQKDDYFHIPSFKDEFEQQPVSETDINAARERLESKPLCTRIVTGSAEIALKYISSERLPERIGAASETQINKRTHAAL